MPTGVPVRRRLMIEGEVPLLSKAAAPWVLPEVEHLMNVVASYYCDSMLWIHQQLPAINILAAQAWW